MLYASIESTLHLFKKKKELETMRPLSDTFLYTRAAEVYAPRASSLSSICGMFAEVKKRGKKGEKKGEKKGKKGGKREKRGKNENKP